MGAAHRGPFAIRLDCFACLVLYFLFLYVGDYAAKCDARFVAKKAEGNFGAAPKERHDQQYERRSHDKFKKLFVAELLRQKNVRHANDAIGRIGDRGGLENGAKDLLIDLKNDAEIFHSRFIRGTEDAKDKRKDTKQKGTKKGSQDKPSRRSKRSASLAGQADDAGKSLNAHQVGDEHQNLRDMNDGEISSESIRRLDVTVEEDKKPEGDIRKSGELLEAQSLFKKTPEDITQEKIEHPLNNEPIAENIKKHIKKDSAIEKAVVLEGIDEKVNPNDSDVNSVPKNSFDQLDNDNKRSMETTKYVESQKIEEEASEKKLRPDGHTLSNLKQKSKTVLNAINQEHSRHFRLAKIHQLRTQALEIQQRLRDLSFLKKLRDQVGDIIPGIPRFSENQLLTTLRSIIAAKNIHTDPKDEIDLSRVSTLNNNQIDIIKCAQQLVPVRERQSFTENIVECISGLNVFNCLRIFIYPILVEAVPESLVHSFPSLPIELNVADLVQGDRDQYSRQYLRQALLPTGLGKLNREMIIFSILDKNLLNAQTQGYAKSAFHSKRLGENLSCDQAKIIQTMEKFLPEEARQIYMSNMEICLSRFTFMSCVKNFGWPLVREYNPEVPDYPFPDPYVMVTPLSPLSPYPGFVSNLTPLPEISKAPERSSLPPGTLVFNLFKKSVHTYPNSYPQMPLITPIQLNINAKPGPEHLGPKKLQTLKVAEQLLPASARKDYEHDTSLCLKQFDYNTCILQRVLPMVRQYNPQLPALPQLQQIFQLPNFPDVLQYLQQVPQNTIEGFMNFFGINGRPNPFNPAASAQNRTQDVLELYEIKVIEALKSLTDARQITPPEPSITESNKLAQLPFMNLRKLYILRLAESLVPQSDKEFLKAKILFCLNENDIESCSRTVIWPYLTLYVPEGMPVLPPLDKKPSAQTGKEKEGGLADAAAEISPTKADLINSGENAPEILIQSRSKIKDEDVKIETETEPLLKTRTPTIHVHETNYYPTLVENPENVIYNIIKSVPATEVKFEVLATNFSQLTDRQQEILQTVANQIPENARQNFFVSMYNCMQNFNFLICSRDVIWPTLVQYFPNLPAFPSFISLLTNRNVSLSNATDPTTSHNPLPIETNVGTLKYGESTVTIFDTKFVPLFPAHPESVIFNILKSMKIHSKTLKNSTDNLVDSPEFEKSFSLRQRHILHLAVNLLANQTTTAFLQAVYDCNQKDTFLNCSRDVLFPKMTEIYPKFPKFPNFDKELSGPISSSEIEKFLKQAKSRQIDQNELGSGKLEFPALDFLYKALPEDKNLMLRALINNLPDSIYYDLFVKMNQCVQYSNEVYCANDIMYPTLKQYYDVPGFNLDDFYPSLENVQAPQQHHQPLQPITKQVSVNYEIFCDEMSIMCTLITKTPIQLIQAPPHTETHYYRSQIPYIPFGKSADGRQIYKQIEELWQPNLPPSVGSRSSNDNGVPEHSGQPSSNLINLSQEKVTGDNSSGETAALEEQLKLEASQNLTRVKRDLRNLYDSYAAKVSVEDKNSVPLRFPAKFGDIKTDQELLDFLVRLLKSRQRGDTVNDQNPSSRSEFVDTLNETSRNSLTRDQIEILRLIEHLAPQSNRAMLLRQVFQCIRSLSLIRCVGIFVWPMITQNFALPSLPSIPLLQPFSADQRTQARHNSRAFEKFYDSFGITSEDFDEELAERKIAIEQNLIGWYTKLTDSQFDLDLGPLRFRNKGDREISVRMGTEYREGRGTKSEKGILKIAETIDGVLADILNTKSKKFAARKQNKQRIPRYSRQREIPEELLRDREVINMLMDKIRQRDDYVGDFEDIEAREPLTLDDAYNAFQLLFGPEYEHEIIGDKNGNPEDHPKLIPLEFLHMSKTSDGIRAGKSRNLGTVRRINPKEEKYSFRSLLADYIKKRLYSNRKRLQTGLIVRLPRLNDKISARKMTTALATVGRGMKNKMTAVMPAAGLLLSFMVQMTLAHAKAASTVAEMLSNMALAAASLSMVRDMIMGLTNGNNPKIRYVYDTEKYDPGVTWPMSAEIADPEAFMHQKVV